MVATYTVAGVSSGIYSSNVHGGSGDITALIAVAARVLGSSRVANPITLHIPRLTYLFSSICLRPTHTHTLSISFVSHVRVGIRFVQSWY